MPGITLVLGASEDTSRYSNKAIQLLRKHGHEVYAVGARNGSAWGLPIHDQWQEGIRPETITLYLRPELQKPYYDQMLNSGAQRIIFNPGTENSELAALAATAGIKTEEACTLVLLNSNQYTL